MPRQTKNPGAKHPGNERTPKNRRESEREEQPGGGVTRDKGAAGAPEGGQINGRQGDQEGTRR